MVADHGGRVVGATLAEQHARAQTGRHREQGNSSHPRVQVDLHLAGLLGFAQLVGDELLISFGAAMNGCSARDGAVTDSIA